MKIAIIGYGKMGHMIEEIARLRGHEIVSIVDIDNPEEFNSAAFRSAIVAIEFTAPTSARANVIRCFEAGVKVVSGSTGWLDGCREEMEDYCSRGNTLFWSSNFSIGVALFRAMAAHAARLINDYPQYDVSLCETHHIHKKDAPSGTAITLADTLIDRIDRKTSWQLVDNDNDELPPAAIGIKAVREGEVPGIHTITFDSEEDFISLTHSAYSRRGFALGAVIAAEYTASHTGFLSMNNLFPAIPDAPDL